MHRALAEHVRDRFLGRGVVTAARTSMVATAVEVSLKYSSQPKAQAEAEADAEEMEKPSKQEQTESKTRQSLILNKESGNSKNDTHGSQKFILSKVKKKKKILL